MERKRTSVVPRILAWLIVLAAIAAPIAYVYLHEESVEVTAAPIERGPVEQTVTAISAGTVKAEDDSMIASSFLGIVTAVHVEEGDTVSKGELLVELDHKELDSQVELAEANLEVGVSRLRQAKIAAEIYTKVSGTAVSLAQEQLDLARKNFNRIEELAQREVAAQSNLDEVASSLKVAQENLASAQARQQENQVRAEEILTAESNVKQLEAALAVAKAGREKAFVRAPFDGLVAKVPTDVGEAVTLGMPLLQLVGISNVYVQAPFDEANASEVKLGQTARIGLDAYRGEEFEGEVVFISPVVSLNPDLSRTLDVKIRVTEGREKFVTGMSADVTILVDQKDDVLYVPSETLIRERFAYVVKDGRAVRREVETGIGNWNRREVVSGLEEGEQLITSVSIKELDDGVLVEVVDELDDESF